MTLETKAWEHLKASTSSIVEKTLCCQAAFLRGYSTRAIVLGAFDCQHERISSQNFSNYVSARLNSPVFAGATAELIVGLAYGDSNEAFEMLMTFWEAYISANEEIGKNMTVGELKTDVLNEMELLEAISKHPQAYIGVPSMSAFIGYFLGLLTAQKEFAMKWESELLSAEWEMWVSHYTEIEAHFPWWRKLIAAEGGDDHSALKAFFSLRKQYIGEMHRK